MVEPQWLNDDEREAWLALVALMFKMPGTIERQLVDDEDLSLAEYLVLAMLSEAPDRSHRMSDLAAATFTGQSRLSRIVARLESGDCALDESIKLYERGDRLRAKCAERLDAAQARIEAIRLDAEGRPAGTRPFAAG